MPYIIKTINLGNTAGKTVDLGVNVNYLELRGLTGEQQVRITTGTSAPSDPGAALVGAAPSVNDNVVRLAAGGNVAIGVNGSQYAETIGRFLEIWSVAAGSVTVIARY